jgi:hypothetical protein
VFEGRNVSRIADRETKEKHLRHSGHSPSTKRRESETNSTLTAFRANHIYDNVNFF